MDIVEIVIALTLLNTIHNLVTLLSVFDYCPLWAIEDELGSFMFNFHYIKVCYA